MGYREDRAVDHGEEIRRQRSIRLEAKKNVANSTVSWRRKIRIIRITARRPGKPDLAVTEPGARRNAAIDRPRLSLSPVTSTSTQRAVRTSISSMLSA